MQKQTYKIMKILIVLMMMFTILPTRVRNIIAENNIIVSFNTDGGSEVDSQIIEVGTTATRPIDPTKENYNFVDWYTNDDIPFDFNQTLNEDITLNAKREEIIQETIEEVNNNQEETVLTNNDEVVEQGNNEEIVLDNNQTPALRDSGGTRAITHTITLHYSSIGNDNLATPIVIENVAHGSQIRDSLDLLDKKFNVDGYVDSMFRTPRPLRNYTTWDSINDDFSLTDEVTEDLDIYYLAGIETNNVGINLDLPEINSSTSGTWDNQTQRPNVSLLGGLEYLFTDASNYWLTSSSGMSFFEGTFEEGETYYAFVQLKPLFPYLFGNNPTVSVNNGTIASKETNKELVKVYIGVTLGNEETVLKLGTGRSEGGIIKVEGTKDNLPVADADDGQSTNFSIPYGSNITLTATPNNEYEFVGWYKGVVGSTYFVEDYDESELISTNSTYNYQANEDVLIYGLFTKKKCNVSFVTRNSDTIPNQEIEIGNTATKPSDPTPPHQTLSFRGWYEVSPTEMTSEDISAGWFNFNTPITDNKTLYAVYEGVLYIKTYNLSNNTQDSGGKITYSSIHNSVTNPLPNVATTVIEGSTISLNAIADEEHEFVGWAYTTDKSNAISTSESYNLSINQGNTIYALFDKKELTITFDSNGGDAIESQTIDYGSKATKPSDPTKANLTFKEWVDEEGVTFDFDTEITKDITLTAKYKGRLEMVAWSTSTPQGGYGRGGSVSANKGTSVPPSGVDGVAYEIDEGEEVTITATASDNYEFVCWSTSNSENDGVSNNASYTFTFDKNTTLIAIFKEFKPDLILHFSSIDGDDLLNPIRYEFTYTDGITVGQVLVANGKDMDGTFFTLDGYCDYEEIVAPKPLSEYTSLSEAYDDRILKQQVLDNKDTHLYVLMAKELNEAEISIEAPKHKEETSVPEGGYYYEDQINPPKVSIPDNDFYKLDDSSDYLPAVWVNEDGDEYEGEFIAGNDYYAEIWLEAKYGYVFSDDLAISVNGGEVIDKYDDYDYFGVFVKVKAEKRKYTLTFNLDGGTYNGKSTYTVEYEDGDKIKLPKPTRQGYEFDYWEGSKYYAGQEYTITENHTFKAIWKRPSNNNNNYNPAHVVPDTSAK